MICSATTAQILPREDADAAGLVAAPGARRRASLRCAQQACARRAIEALEKRLHVELGSLRTTNLSRTSILVARPCAERRGLGLEAAGVAYDRRRRDRQRSAADHQSPHLRRRRRLLALTSSRTPPTPWPASWCSNALFLGRAKASRADIPWCTYTDPEVAHVGLSEREASERGVAVRSLSPGVCPGRSRRHRWRRPMALSRCLTPPGYGPHSRRDDRLAPCGGPDRGNHPGDGPAAWASRALSETIHPYPTHAEAAEKVGDAYQRTRLTPFVAWLFRKWLAWLR